MSHESQPFCIPLVTWKLSFCFVDSAHLECKHTKALKCLHNTRLVATWALSGSMGVFNVQNGTQQESSTVRLSLTYKAGLSQPLPVPVLQRYEFQVLPLQQPLESAMKPCLTQLWQNRGSFFLVGQKRLLIAQQEAGSVQASPRPLKQSWHNLDGLLIGQYS